MHEAWKNRANWVRAPCGTTDSRARGDLMIEDDHFCLFLFTNKDDSVGLVTKLSTGGFKPNEIYKVHDTGARSFGDGTMWALTLKNTPDEATVMHAGEGRRGLHPRRQAQAVQRGRESRAPDGAMGIINFSRRFRTDHDFMWFMAFPPGAEKHRLTYLGFHADPFWEDARSDRPSVGAQYASLDKGLVVIGVLHNNDNWKREAWGAASRRARPIAPGSKRPTLASGSVSRGSTAGTFTSGSRFTNQASHSSSRAAPEACPTTSWSASGTARPRPHHPSSPPWTSTGRPFCPGSRSDRGRWARASGSPPE